jgi:hypothetical protein
VKLSQGYMADAARESLRFLNCDLFYSPIGINLLLRALYGTNKRERRNFFKNIIGCRRR